MKKLTTLFIAVGTIISLSAIESRSSQAEQFRLLESTMSSRRREAVSALSKFENREVINKLGQVLTGDSNASVRARAAEVLGNMRNKAGTPYLIEALEDENRTVKNSVIVAFGYIRDPEAVKPLIDFVREEENQSLKASAANILGVIGDERAVPLLVELLEDDAVRVRRVAASALGRIRSPDSTDALINSLIDENADVRLYAVRALGEIGDKEALTALRWLLDREQDRKVKIAIARALGQLGDDRGLPVALRAANSSDTDIKSRGLEALGAIGTVNEQVKSAVMSAYNSNNSRIKRAASTAASFLGIDLP